MSETNCPLCGSQSFYVKDAEDEYEIYEFDLKGGEIVFTPEAGTSELPEVGGDTETFCNRCAWHGNLKSLRR
ncbi:MAG: hypothetical protein JSU72_19675 [Deltaproteobacteria bacterium]|nr:MAG: hypothetical protein JSU72_19675 [Deltaproteobacteria bacterium]